MIKQKYKKFIPFAKHLSFVKNELFPHKENFLFPFIGSLNLETRIILYPGEYFYRLIHSINKEIKIPIKIKSNNNTNFSKQTFVKIRYKKYEPIIIDIKKILNQNKIDLSNDYVIDLKLEIKLRPSNFNFQMKCQDGSSWGNFIAHWPNFKNNKGNLVMLNPKIKKSDKLQVYNLIMYASTYEDLDKNLKCKYLLMNEKGEKIIIESCNIKKGSFEIIPHPNKLKNLENGRYFLSATGNTAAVSFSIALNKTNKFVDLEHTQPIYKYHSKEKKISDIKNYWQNLLENNE